MRPLYKHFNMLGEYLKLAIKRQVEFKASFYTFILHQGLMIAVWLFFWKVLISKLGNLGLWDFNRMVMLVGYVSINMGMFAIFGYIWRMPRDILNGSLNSHLIKPVHPFMHMMLKHMNLRSLPRLTMGIAVVIYGICTCSKDISTVSILLASVMSVLSFLTALLPFATLCLSAFWIGRAEFLRDLFIELFLFHQYPLSEFPRLIIIFFSLCVPLIFSATAPVLVLTQWSPARAILVLAGMIIIIALQITIFSVIWKKGLRRYESFGG